MAVKTANKRKPDAATEQRQAPPRQADTPADDQAAPAAVQAEAQPQAAVIVPPLLDRARIDLIKRTLCKDLTDDELQLFILQCNRTGLDPFSRQIHAIKRQGKLTIQTAIDGYRLIADRTGRYAGNDDPVFDDEETHGKATVTVWKIVGGERRPFTASARWAQYYPGDGPPGFMWRKMPHLMLGKVAEALALRKAFPAELSGLYVREELPEDEAQQATATVIVGGQHVAGPALTHEPPPAAESAPARADFHAGLLAYDAKLAADGLCPAGALITHVAQEGKALGHPADLTLWDAAQVAAAKKWTAAFARQRHHVTLLALLENKGETPERCLKALRKPPGASLAMLSNDELWDLIQRLRKVPDAKGRQGAA